jgi:hypothetical protein
MKSKYLLFLSHHRGLSVRRGGYWYYCNLDTVAERLEASRHIRNEEVGEHMHWETRHFLRRRVRGHISEPYHT